MKALLVLLATVLSTQAFAYGAEQVYFTCKTFDTPLPMTVYVSLERSESDGINVDEVKFLTHEIESEVKQNNQFGEDKGPTKISFTYLGHQVTLQTKIDMFDAAFKPTIAKLTFMGATTLLKCNP